MYNLIHLKENMKQNELSQHTLDGFDDSGYPKADCVIVTSSVSPRYAEERGWLYYLNTPLQGLEPPQRCMGKG
jgi:hypothetical protein